MTTAAELDFENESFVLLDDSSSPDATCTLYRCPRTRSDRREPEERTRVLVGRSLSLTYFRGLRGEIRADTSSEIAFAKEQLAAATARGLHAAGFMSYELGYHLEPTLSGHAPPPDGTVPLLWFGLFDSKEEFASREFAARMNAKECGRHAGGQAPYEVAHMRSSVTCEEYVDAIHKARLAACARIC